MFWYFAQHRTSKALWNVNTDYWHLVVFEMFSFCSAGQTTSVYYQKIHSTLPILQIWPLVPWRRIITVARIFSFFSIFANIRGIFFRNTLLENLHTVSCRGSNNDKLFPLLCSSTRHNTCKIADAQSTLHYTRHGPGITTDLYVQQMLHPSFFPRKERKRKLENLTNEQWGYETQRPSCNWWDVCNLETKQEVKWKVVKKVCTVSNTGHSPLICAVFWLPCQTEW